MVQFVYQERLANVESNLRRVEDEAKGEIQARAQEIEALRNSALSPLTSRRTALDSKRIDAIERLWSTIIALSQMSSAVSMAGTTKFEEVATAVKKNEEMRYIFGKLAERYDIHDFGKIRHDGQSARLFISDYGWALFSAYEAIVVGSVVQLQLVAIGYNPDEHMDISQIARTAQAALPDLASDINDRGPLSYPDVMTELERRLLCELKKDMQGRERDQENIELAARIVQAAEEARTGRSKAEVALGEEQNDNS